jgi:hypothetical protein
MELTFLNMLHGVTSAKNNNKNSGNSGPGEGL